MRKSGVAVMTASHIIDDMYQGAIPALIPFLVTQRGYNFATVSGITLAATVLSSVAQPAFGIITDKYRLWWLVALGLTIAGIGVGLVGLTDSYPLTLACVAFSGLGVAAFHPEAARTARAVSEGSTIGMSWFSLGGNIGFAIGPIFTTTVVLTLGLGATPVLAIPALMMGTFLIFALPRLTGEVKMKGKRVAAVAARDDWRNFGTLTAVVILRSVLFFGLSSFIALYIIKITGQGAELGAFGLTLLLGSGACGTMLGGWLADRFGRLFVVRLSYALTIPAMVALVFSPAPWIFGVIAVIGVSAYLPFAVMVTLGQDYLPNRVGTASGITIGLAVSAGGLASPLLGTIADNAGLQTMLLCLVAVPIVAFGCSFLLTDPNPRPRKPLVAPDVVRPEDAVAVAASRS